MKKGKVAHFFHPKTLGVMHLGTVVRVLDSGMVRVRFAIDGKIYTTFQDHF